MKDKFTTINLIDFEKEVIREWKKGETYGPIHLSGGNEEQLIEIFKKIKPNDWVFSTHRSHYHALLKSNDRDWLINEIIVNANSSHINSNKYKIFTSAIVGGNIPIALGVAMGTKRNWDNNIRYIELTNNIKKKRKEGNYSFSKGEVIGKCLGISHVWCFVGDMASEMGCFNEALKYAVGEDLPITFIIEDNGLGCDTPTNKVWRYENLYKNFNKFDTYEYKRFYPHCGTGDILTFKKKFKSTGDYNAYK